MTQRLLIAVALLQMPAISKPDVADRLQPPVEASTERLALADTVALAKWDKNTPVEDTVRETQVVLHAIKDGEARSLTPAFVSTFFRAQIALLARQTVWPVLTKDQPLFRLLPNMRARNVHADT
jgi:chorismate mutase